MHLKIYLNSHFTLAVDLEIVGLTAIEMEQKSHVISVKNLCPQLFCSSALFSESHFSAFLTLLFYQRTERKGTYIILTHPRNSAHALGSTTNGDLYRQQHFTHPCSPKVFLETSLELVREYQWV